MWVDGYYPQTECLPGKRRMGDDSFPWALSIVTEPATEPVSVSDVKLNARVEIAEDDLFIAQRIVSARRLAEAFTKRTFVTTTLRLNLDYFPSWEIFLKRPPLVSVTWIKYTDTNGTQQTISSGDYTVDTYSEPGRVTPAYGVSWPSGREHTNSIEVKYVAGYGAASAVPQSIKDAITLTVTQWYENRGDDGEKKLSELPAAAKSLLSAEGWGYLP